MMWWESIVQDPGQFVWFIITIIAGGSTGFVLFKLIYLIFGDD